MLCVSTRMRCLSYSLVANLGCLLPASVCDGACTLVSVNGVDALAGPTESWAAGVSCPVTVHTSIARRADTAVPTFVTSLL